MTLSLYAAGEYLADLASNAGWWDFVDWADTLPEEVEDLNHLVEYGWTEQPHDTARQLGHALEVQPPAKKEIRSVAAHLLRLLGSVAVDAPVVVSDGSGDLEPAIEGALHAALEGASGPEERAALLREIWQAYP